MYRLEGLCVLERRCFCDNLGHCDWDFGFDLLDGLRNSRQGTPEEMI